MRSMTTRFGFVLSALTLAVALVGCRSEPAGPDTSSAGLQNNEATVSGIEGYIYRGPIEPVAREGQENDEPFVGNFFAEIYDVSIPFSTDENGWFSIGLAPGDYKIVSDEPHPFYPNQAFDVPVTEDNYTNVWLDFDTGIR